MGGFLQGLGFSGTALIIIGAILTPLCAWFIRLLNRNYKILSDAKKDIEIQRKDVIAMLSEIKKDQTIFNSNSALKRSECMDTQQRATRENSKRLNDSISKYEKEYVSKTEIIMGRIESNRSTLCSSIERITSAMNTYDRKLAETEKRIRDGAISKGEYYSEISKIKDSFYKELHDCKNKMTGVNVLVENIPELADASKRLIELNKTLLDYEKKFSDYDKTLKKQAEIIEKNERENTERHRISKEILTKSISEVKKESKSTVSKVASIVNTHRLSTQKQIMQLQEKDKFGKVIKRKNFNHD